MPADNPSNEAPPSDYSKFDKQQSSTKPQPTNPSQSQSTAASPARPPRHDSLNVKLHTGERERDSRKYPPDTPSDVTTANLNKQRTLKAQSGLSNSNQETIPERNSSGPLGHEHGAPGDRAQPSSNTTPNTSSVVRVSLKTTQAAGPLGPQQSHGATEDTSAGGSTAHHSSATTSGRRQDTQTPSAHRTVDGQQDRTSEIKQYTQAPLHAGYGQGFMNTIMSTIIPSGGPLGPLPPRDQQLKEEYFRVRDELRQARAISDNADRELKRRMGELRRTNQYIGHLEHENQRFKDSISGLQNELNSVHQQLDDARNLSEVRGKELFGAQVFLTKADTLSISEVGEKVTALNEEIFQAAATLGDALVHNRYELSQTEFDAAAAESQRMVGEKLTNTLIAQSRKPEPEVNPLLVQVVLQIFMVKFCVSKIQSWYHGDSAIDSAIGEFLAAIYSEIRSTEEQAVSGRWRALTRAHTRPTTDTWKKELYLKLQSVFVVSSWKPQSSEHEESYGHRLPSIFKAVNELRMAIGEKFTSADLEISVFECDKIYDPATMDDAYSDGRQSSGKRAPEAIVGTTGIGLGKITVKRSAEDDALQLRTIIPAKIVLRSTLNEALEPILQSSKLRKKKKFESTADGADPEGRRGNNGSKSKAGANMDTT